MIAFSIIGAVEPAGSKRAFVRGNRAIIVDDNAKGRGWKANVAQAAGHFSAQAEAEGLFDGPLLVELTFYRPRPKGHYGSGRNSAVLRAGAPAFPTTKPDALKLARGVEDALTGVLYRDDSQIVREVLEKHYGIPARCEVRLSRHFPSPGVSPTEKAEHVMSDEVGTPKFDPELPGNTGCVC